MDSSLGSCLLCVNPFMKIRQLMELLFSHLSALGRNYMCGSTEMMMNSIIKRAVMGELQKCERKSLT